MWHAASGFKAGRTTAAAAAAAAVLLLMSRSSSSGSGCSNGRVFGNCWDPSQLLHSVIAFYKLQRNKRSGYFQQVPIHCQISYQN
jgi:hypothetical protein